MTQTEIEQTFDGVMRIVARRFGNAHEESPGGAPRSRQIRIGERNGARVVISLAGRNKFGQQLFLVRCDCGDEQKLNAQTVRNTKGCRRCAQRRP